MAKARNSSYINNINMNLQLTLSLCQSRESLEKVGGVTICNYLSRRKLSSINHLKTSFYTYIHVQHQSNIKNTFCLLKVEGSSDKDDCFPK